MHRSLLCFAALFSALLLLPAFFAGLTGEITPPASSADPAPFSLTSSAGRVSFSQKSSALNALPPPADPAETGKAAETKIPAENGRVPSEVKTTAENGWVPSEVKTTAENGRVPAEVTVQVLMAGSGEMRLLPLEDYVLGVLLAEMPASFAPDALRAQAVAARTLTLYQMQNGGHHADADICTDPGCCAAWIDPESAAERWGADTAADLLAVMRAAVSDTAGEIVTYQGKPICAAFHASSAQMTASSAEVWGGDLPYLRAVSSPEVLTPKVVTVSADRLASLLAASGITVSGSSNTWIGRTSYTESGRIASVDFCGSAVGCAVLRRLFSLPSASFSVSFDGSAFLFACSGSGHGVGLSQYGADAMARTGASWREILAHYYPGTAVEGLTR